MRCRKCNAPDFEKVAVILSKEGWYKGVIPAQLEVLVCQQCGNKESFIEMSGGYMPLDDIWVAQWKPQPGAQSDFFKEGYTTSGPKTEAYMGGYGPRIIHFDSDFEGRQDANDFKFTHRWGYVHGYTANWSNVDEAREYFMKMEADPSLKKLKEELEHIMNPFKHPIYQPEEPGEKAKRKLDEIVKKAEEEQHGSDIH